jgi:hypothetical protein
MNVIARGSYLVRTKQRTLQLVPEVKGFVQHKAPYLACQHALPNGEC